MRKVSKKIENVKAQTSQEEIVMHPSIDETSRRIVEEKLAEKRGGRPIHERLHELNKEILEKHQHKREAEHNKFRS